MFLWLMKLTKLRMDPLLPRAQEKTVEENKELPRPLQDIAVTDPSGGAGGAHSPVEYDPDFLGLPNPIDQLVAALRDACLNVTDQKLLIFEPFGYCNIFQYSSIYFNIFNICSI